MLADRSTTNFMNKIVPVHKLVRALMGLGLLGIAACNRPVSPGIGDGLMEYTFPTNPVFPVSLPIKLLQGPGWTVWVPSGPQWTQTQQQQTWQMVRTADDVTVMIQYQDNIPLAQVPRTVFPTDPEPDLTPAQLKALSPEERSRRMWLALLQKVQIPTFFQPTLLNESIRMYVLGVLTLSQRQDPYFQLCSWALGTIRGIPAVQIQASSSVAGLFSTGKVSLPLGLTYALHNYLIFLKNQAVGIWVRGPLSKEEEIQQLADAIAFSLVPSP